MGNFKRAHYEAVKDYISVSGFELKVKLPFESSRVHPTFNNFISGLGLDISNDYSKVRLSEFDSFYSMLSEENFGVKGEVLQVSPKLHIPFVSDFIDWKDCNGYYLGGGDMLPIPKGVPSVSKYILRSFEGLHVQPFDDKDKSIARILYEIWPDKYPFVDWTPPVKEAPKKKGLLARILG